MTNPGRPFAFPVRLMHRETVDSFTRRVLDANHELPDLPKRLRSSHESEAEFRWVDVLASKTGHEPNDFTAPDGGFLHHNDGTTCPQCPELASRRLCTHCSAGALVDQHPHHDSPICRKHKRWVGYEPNVAAQLPIGAAQIAAARALRRLRIAGRYEHRIFLLILRTLAPQPEAEPDMFPLAVKILQAVTARSFLLRLLDPARTYSSAHQLLVHTLSTLTTSDDVTRALWAALRGVFAHLYGLRHGRASIPAPWVHGFPVPWDVLATATGAGHTFEPFFAYLRAAGMTLRDTIRIERQHLLLEHDRADGHHFRSLCDNGHRLIVRRDGKPVLACGVCRPALRPGVNDLHTKSPRLTAEWDADANAGIMPEMVPAGSSQDYWWRCSRGHPFEATPGNRFFNRTACPVCMNRLILVGVNDLAATHPEVAAELDARYDPTELTSHSEKNLPFTCANGHRYLRRVVDRVAGKSCMECTRRTLVQAGKSIVDTHPHVAAEWHPHLNKFGPEHYSAGSRETPWWLCAKGHSFKQRIERRTKAGYCCGVCSKRQRVIGTNDLATTDPELASEWHPFRNWTPPTDVTAIDKLFWWKCSANGHDYQQTVDHRRKSRGCPQCTPDERVLAA